MKNIVGILLISLVVASVMTSFTKSGSETGIKFTNSTLAEAQTEASKSKKLVFVFAYTSWSGPSKYMEATPFKDQEVGKLFNDNFVNLKMDMEKGDGPSFALKYNVKAYPTLLILEANGNILKSVAGVKQKDDLLAFAKSAL